MKHLFCIVAALLLLAPKTEAQDQRLYWKYKDYDGSMSFTIPGFLPKIGSIFIKGKAERRLVRRTGKIRIMVFENGSPVTEKDFVKFARRAENSGLDDLIHVRDGKTHVRIMGKENGKRIRKLVVLVQDEGEFVMVSMKGRYKYSDLNALIKKYQQETPQKDKDKKKKKNPLPIKIPVAQA